MDEDRMLRMDYMSSSFRAVSKSHLFCSIWCNRRLVLTYICNPVKFQIFLPNTPRPLHVHYLSTDHLFELFQNHTYLTEFSVTGDLFWLTYAILPNTRYSYQTPPTLTFLNAHHFSMAGAGMLRLDSMSLSFEVVSYSHLFCSIWCNRRLILTYIYNSKQLQIFLPNTPYPSIFKCLPFLKGWS